MSLIEGVEPESLVWIARDGNGYVVSEGDAPQDWREVAVLHAALTKTLEMLDSQIADRAWRGEQWK